MKIKTKVSLTTWVFTFIGMLITINLISLRYPTKQAPRFQVCTANIENTRLMAEWIAFHEAKFDTCVVGKRLSIKSGMFSGSVEEQCNACFDNANPILVLNPNEYLNIPDIEVFMDVLDKSNSLHRVYFGHQEKESVLIAHSARGPTEALKEDKEKFKPYKDCAETEKDGNSCMDIFPVAIMRGKLPTKQLNPIDASVGRIHHYSLGNEHKDKEKQYWKMIFDDSILQGLDIKTFKKSINNFKLELVF
jgi:hypothetical protein